jgi:hypothetical protein
LLFLNSLLDYYNIIFINNLLIISYNFLSMIKIQLQIQTSHDLLLSIFYLFIHFILDSIIYLNLLMELMVLLSLLYSHQKVITHVYYLLSTSELYRNDFDTLNTIRDILIDFSYDHLMIYFPHL